MPLIIAGVLYLDAVVAQHVAEASVGVRGVADFKGRAILLRLVGVLLSRVATGAKVAHVAVVVGLYITRSNVLVAVQRVVTGNLILTIQHRGCRHERAAK